MMHTPSLAGAPQCCATYKNVAYFLASQIGACGVGQSELRFPA